MLHFSLVYDIRKILGLCVSHKDWSYKQRVLRQKNIEKESQGNIELRVLNCTFSTRSQASFLWKKCWRSQTKLKIYDYLFMTLESRDQIVNNPELSIKISCKINALNIFQTLLLWFRQFNDFTCNSFIAWESIIDAKILIEQNICRRNLAEAILHTF